VHHNVKSADLTVEAVGEFHPVTDAEVELIEAYLGDLIPAILLIQDEEE
jgi:hypothetical protein